MRGPTGGPDDKLYAFGPFVADPVTGSLRQDGVPVVLTLKSFEVLLALIERRGQVVDKDVLLKLVWPDTIVEENNLARHISTLRKVLNDQPQDHQYIVTVPGRGYRFVAPVQELLRSALPAPLDEDKQHFKRFQREHDVYAVLTQRTRHGIGDKGAERVKLVVRVTHWAFHLSSAFGT